MFTKAADALPSGKWVVPSEGCIVSKRMENRLTMLNKTYIHLGNHGEHPQPAGRQTQDQTLRKVSERAITEPRRALKVQFRPKLGHSSEAQAKDRSYKCMGMTATLSSRERCWLGLLYGYLKAQDSVMSAKRR